MAIARSHGRRIEARTGRGVKAPRVLRPFVDRESRALGEAQRSSQYSPRQRQPDESPDRSEVELAAGLRALIAKEVRVEVARQLAAAEASPEPGGLLTVAEVAVRIGMSVSFVRAAIRDGRLQSERLGRAVRVHASAVTALTALTHPRRTGPRVDPTARAERILGVGHGRR